MSRIVVGFLLLLAATAIGADRATSSVGSSPQLFAPAKVDEARQRVFDSLGEMASDLKQKIESLWSNTDSSIASEALLELVIRSFAQADAQVMQLIRDSDNPLTLPANNHLDAFNRSSRNSFYRANVGLYLGRFLIERKMYDEAWDILKGLDDGQVVDPASLFFFRAIAAQGMLEIKSALESLDRLIANTERVPPRYLALATLMQSELKDYQEKSLEEIARLMSDSERRLELGRAGEKIQGVQERIISILDELIKKAEQEQNGGGGGGGSGGENEKGGQNNQSMSPSDDSKIKGSEAPGETDKKKFDNKGNWGNLHDKDVAKAKSDLNKNFPSHYEQAIDKYTKKLAAKQAKKK